MCELWGVFQGDDGIHVIPAETDCSPQYPHVIDCFCDCDPELEYQDGEVVFIHKEEM